VKKQHLSENSDKKPTQRHLWANLGSKIRGFFEMNFWAQNYNLEFWNANLRFQTFELDENECEAEQATPGTQTIFDPFKLKNIGSAAFQRSKSDFLAILCQQNRIHPP
jgi:hypothetical protein